MFKLRIVMALTLFFAVAAVGCGAEDPSSGEDTQVFEDYDGPEGSLVDYNGTSGLVLSVGTSAPWCPSGQHAVVNRYGRWICVPN